MVFRRKRRRLVRIRAVAQPSVVLAVSIMIGVSHPPPEFLDKRHSRPFALDRAWVLSMLTENAKRSMQVEPVRDREGNPIGQYTYQGAVANKALELLGKELGMFQPKPEPEGSIHELMARLNAGRDRAAKEKLEREAKAADLANLPN
jgi:hypothetical protein